MKRFRAFAPATIANLGVGFDVLGLAVDALGDVVTVELKDGGDVELVEVTGDQGRLSRDPQKNTASIAAHSVLRLANAKQGVRIWLEKGLPLASGLGSSAASAVAAAVATNAALGEPLSREDLLPAVLDAEAMVSGRHADNVAPALLGGIVLITGLNPGEIHRLPLPSGIYFALVTPNIEIPTAQAREILPKMVPLNVLVHQTGVVAELIHALHKGNVHLLAQSMQRDAVVESAREVLIPKLPEAREVAQQVGALATVISGAGPTLCSLCVTAQDAEAVCRAMVDFYNRESVGATGRTARPAPEGAYLLSS